VYIIVRFMAKILKAENIQTDILGSNGNSAFSLQRNSSSLLTLHTNDCVGINTTSPSHLFEVRGSSFPKICITSDDQSIDTGATFRIDLKNASSQLFEAGTISVRHVASNQTADAESAYMSFSTRNNGAVAERLRIDSSGNVGIGTTSPSAKLNVNGSILATNGNIEANASSGNIYVQAVSTAGTLALYSRPDISQLLIDATGNPLTIRTVSAQPLVLGTNSAERLRIDSSGNVGIGTTSPGAQLSVSGGTTNVNLGQLSGNPNFSGISLGTATTVAAGNYTLLSDSAGTDLRIGRVTGGHISFTENNGTAQVVIKSGGNVGIGTTSPARQLHVNSRAIIDSNQDGSTTVPSLSLGALTTGFSYIATNNIAALTNGTERLRINANGTLLIGTTSDTSGGVIKLRISDGTIDSAYGYKTGGVEYVGTITNHPIAVLTNNAERLRITSTGNVGIGTTNPSTMLHVAGVITHSAGTIGSNANGTRTVTTTTTTPVGGADGDIVLVI
jgi:hypothetical protein